MTLTTRLVAPIALCFAAALAVADEIVPAEGDAVAEPATIADEVRDIAAAQAGAGTETDEERLAGEFGRFKDLMANELLDEADTSAKRIIELAIASHGPESIEMAKALTNLAIVQHRKGEYDLAEQNYESAVEIIEDNEDRLNSQLVNPLKGLAAAQLAGGRPDLAAQNYSRAVHITHVNEGPHNLEQVGLLEDLAEVQLQMGDIDAAKDILEMIFGINARAYREDGIDIVPGLMRRADWQHRAGLIYDERATYRSVIRIVEERDGKDDLQLVEPLVRLGRSFFYTDASGQQAFQQMSMTSGEIYFKRALRIAAESPETNWNVVADATLALGDYYMFDGNVQRARQVYLTAWDLLSESDDNQAKLDKRRDELETPVTLRSQPLPAFYGEVNPSEPPPADDVIRQGHVTVSFSISTRGRASDLELVEVVPPEIDDMQKQVEREIRRRVYRPVFIDGEAVETTNQVFVHSFSYRQSDLDKAEDDAGADEDST